MFIINGHNIIIWKFVFFLTIILLIVQMLSTVLNVILSILVYKLLSINLLLLLQ